MAKPADTTTAAMVPVRPKSGSSTESAYSSPEQDGARDLKLKHQKSVGQHVTSAPSQPPQLPPQSSSETVPSSLSNWLRQASPNVGSYPQGSKNSMISGMFNSMPYPAYGVLPMDSQQTMRAHGSMNPLASHPHMRGPQTHGSLLQHPEMMPYASHIRTIIDSVTHGKPVPKGILPKEADLDAIGRKKAGSRKRSSPKARNESKRAGGGQAKRQYVKPMPGFTTAGFTTIPPPIPSPIPLGSQPLHISGLHPSAAVAPSKTIDPNPSVLKTMLKKNGYGPHVSDGRQTESPGKNWTTISSGFDALVAFASSELDRNREMRRRSGEGDSFLEKSPPMQGVQQGASSSSGQDDASRQTRRVPMTNN